ncbi:MAG: malonyl-ACP O-methyltransferase BioC, partial [Xanthomonadaceae bacterium]|nr:malonyl-ACP O-methyltransferase BioC [Xanthomonadaceae bacterium]
AEARLLESLAYLDDPALARKPPQRILDLGCGTGSASRFLQKRWPKAEVLSMDLALPMLQHARRASKTWNPFAQAPRPLCADARRLPLAEGTLDVIFSNLCLQWVEDLEGVLNGFRRALKPQGLLLFSTFGPETLWELRGAFAQADAAPHVSAFVDTAGVGDALVNTGFFQPVVDRDEEVTHYPAMTDLMRELRDLGATNALASRRHTLTGRGRFAAAAHAYEGHRSAAGLPATWEVISAMAWAPEPGAPIREGGADLVAVPVSRIPIRRR